MNDFTLGTLVFIAIPVTFALQLSVITSLLYKIYMQGKQAIRVDTHFPKGIKVIVIDAAEHFGKKIK